MVEMINAFAGLIIITIILVVMIPVTQALLPSMVDSMGSQVGIMVELSIIAILVGGIYVFITTMMYGEQHANIQHSDYSR